MTVERRKVTCPHCQEPFYIEVDFNTEMMITGISTLWDSKRDEYE